MGLRYANPSFSQLAEVLTKIALQGARVVLCIPDWGTTGEHAFWRRLLDRMTVGRTELLNGPIYSLRYLGRPYPALNGAVSCPS